MPNNPRSEVDFYQQYNLSRMNGWTPSIVNMLGGVSTMDSYTPVAYARYTYDQYSNYLVRGTGRPASIQELVDYLYKVADKYGIDRKVAYGQIKKESGFDPNAVNQTSGATGIAQFIVNTARSYGLRVGGGVDDRKDPYKSLDAWGRYMRDLLDQFGGDYSKALASYNWGEGRVAKAIARLGEGWIKGAPSETQAYVDEILYPEGESAEDFQKRGGKIDTGNPCGTFDIGCQLNQFFGGEVAKDVSKRVGLVLVAIVILAVAVISLR